MVSLNNVTYAIRNRELCRWTHTFVGDDPENDDMGSMGRYDVEHEKAIEDNDAESMAGIIDDIGQKCGKASEAKCSVTPEFQPGFSLNSKGNQQDSVSLHKQPDGDSNNHIGFLTLERLEETIKVGTTLGLNMKGYENTRASLIVENGELNMIYESSVKYGATLNSILLPIRPRGMSGGLWIPNDVRIMWIVVYVPQNLSCKIALWSSLANLISNWDGNLVVMGDFNEFREVASILRDPTSGGILDCRTVDGVNTVFLTSLKFIKLQVLFGEGLCEGRFMLGECSEDDNNEDDDV
ncbi:RNA-directed DNA polymerase, eukaryota, reverse transcriptase zinc-binding domain protein [Tanacetum coccineum]